MAFTPGIKSINKLTADQPVVSSIVPVDITGFSIVIQPGKQLEWELRGVMTTGATGGFRIVANSTSAPSEYNAEWVVTDVTTPATFVAAQLVQADFTNASAVATNYKVEGKGFIQANLLTTFSIKFAQNNSTANPIIMQAGMTISLWQF